MADETETSYIAAEGSIVRLERYISDRGVLVLESPAMIVGSGAPEPLIWRAGTDGSSASGPPTTLENGDLLITGGSKPNPRAYTPMPPNTDIRFVMDIDRRSGRILIRASDTMGLLGNTLFDSVGTGIASFDHTFNSAGHFALHVIVIDGTPREAVVNADATLRSV